MTMTRMPTTKLGITLRLWRRGGATHSTPWPFARSAAAGRPAPRTRKVPLLWRDYAWGPVQVAETARKLRFSGAYRIGASAPRSAGRIGFNYVALAGRMVPFGVFGMEKPDVSPVLFRTK